MNGTRLHGKVEKLSQRSALYPLCTCLVHCSAPNPFSITQHTLPVMTVFSVSDVGGSQDGRLRECSIVCRRDPLSSSVTQQTLTEPSERERFGLFSQPGFSCTSVFAEHS